MDDISSAQTSSSISPLSQAETVQPMELEHTSPSSTHEAPDNLPSTAVQMQTFANVTQEVAAPQTFGNPFRVPLATLATQTNDSNRQHMLTTSQLTEIIQNVCAMCEQQKTTSAKKPRARPILKRTMRNQKRREDGKCCLGMRMAILSVIERHRNRCGFANPFLFNFFYRI